MKALLKTCNKCKEDKPLEEYWYHPLGKHKKRPKCKKCDYEDKMEWSRANKEKCREYSKKAYKKYRKKYAIRDREKNRKQQRKMRAEKHPRILASTAVNNAIRSGQIERGSCEICGEPEAEAHHPNGYDKEHWFDIKWLCRKHHFEEHGANYYG